MKSPFQDKHDILLLEDLPKGYLQVLLPEFTLTKKGDKSRRRLLDIALKEKLYAIRKSAGKKKFFEVIRETLRGERRLRRELADFETDRRVLSRRFDCSAHPLRFGNGGVLPVIRWSRERKHEHNRVDEYFCLFYRDIFPIGWNIANGASDDFEEMKNPEPILLREFGEELLIRDDAKHIIYTFDPGRDKDPGASPSKARKAWERTHPEIAKYTAKSLG